jgi:5-methylcytosine-specific restriction endonuclease McrA
LYGDSTGNYRRLAFDKLPNKCAACDYDKIPWILEVHHKDRDRSNNDIENLEILCPNCHTEEHYHKRDGKWKNGVMV